MIISWIRIFLYNVMHWIIRYRKIINHIINKELHLFIHQNIIKTKSFYWIFTLYDNPKFRNLLPILWNHIGSTSIFRPENQTEVAEIVDLRLFWSHTIVSVYQVHHFLSKLLCCFITSNNRANYYLICWKLFS